jgi:hypothetical protein
MPKIESLFPLIERLHTILSDIFPHEGLKQIGGSKIFIGSTVFPLVRETVETIKHQIGETPHLSGRETLMILLHEAVQLTLRIEQKGRDADPEAINIAAKLLYFVSGTIWNLVSSQYSKIPPHDENYVRVEPLVPLLAKCPEWRRSALIEPEVLAKEIIADVRQCLQ